MSLTDMNNNRNLNAAAKANIMRHLKKPHPMTSTFASEESLKSQNSIKIFEKHVNSSGPAEEEVTSILDNSLNASLFSYKTTLQTEDGESLVLTGKSLKTILEAYKILCKGLNATLVRMETVPYDPSLESPPDYNSDHEESSGDLPQENMPVIRYSKQELLLYSLSKLSKCSPPNWNVLTYIHPLCCLPAHKVTNYFHPAYFHPHDGNLVKQFNRPQINV